MKKPSIYLAGPEVFLPGAYSVGEEKCRRAAAMGLEGLFPLDESFSGEVDQAMARQIFDSNWALMCRADGCIANLTPFRGPGADPGTAYEVGVMVAWGKPVVGYSLDARDYCQRVPHNAGRDGQGLVVEDFGLGDNLMLETSIEKLGGRVLRGTLTGTPTPAQWPGWTLFDQALRCWRDRFGNAG